MIFGRAGWDPKCSRRSRSAVFYSHVGDNEHGNPLDADGLTHSQKGCFNGPPPSHKDTLTTRNFGNATPRNPRMIASQFPRTYPRSTGIR